MGKAGRIACIFTPFVLTLGALVCISLVLLGGTNKSNHNLQKYYFFRANLTGITSSSSDSSSSDDLSSLLSELTSAESSTSVANYYEVYLWNYCSGSTAGNESYCSAKSSSFWFNPEEVWGLNTTSLEDLIPSELKKGLKIYHKVSHWMMIAYVCAFATTLSEIVVGVFAMCSRWGSLATTIISSLSSFFIFASALISTILFSTVTATFDSALKSYGIKASMGHSVFVATWLAVAFSWASGFFWFLSVCCCSGRSPYHKDADRSRGLGGVMASGRGRTQAEKAPYTYERVESPYMSGAQQTGVTRDVPANDSPYKSDPYSNAYNNTYNNGYGYAGVPNHQYNQSVPMNNLQSESPKKQRSYEPFRQV